MQKNTSVLLLILFVLIHASVSFAQTSVDTLHADGQRFLDSLIAVHENTLAPLDNVIFSSQVADSFQLKSTPRILGNCTELPIIQPGIVTAFDTLEYFQFKRAQGKSFQDSLNFLGGNDILDQWKKIYLGANRLMLKMETLGIDINVDFGKVISTSFYKDGFITLYINKGCMAGKGIAQVKLYSKNKGFLDETDYLIYPDLILRYRGQQ